MPGQSLLRLLLTACAVALASAAPAAGQVVISEVYGGGGNAGATLTHDYIELFNRGTTDVDLTGWSVQYGSATGNIGSGDASITPLSGSIPAGGYVLVQEAQGAGGSVPLLADITDLTPIAMAATAGKVALVNTATGLNCGATGTAADPCTAAELATIVDLVGYGATATFFEGAGPAPVPSNTTSASRQNGGCTDTNDNASDFTAGPTNPQNRLVLPAPCVTDAAPSVSSSTPANGAIGVPLDWNVSVTFSEPVTVTGTWFTIACATSGAHTAAVSGGPTTFTLDPDTDFSASESCTVTIEADNVADQDGTAQTMAADHSFSFTTANPPLQIHQVQGATHISPRLGEVVTVEPSIVTARRSNGFFLQDASPDADPATSDAVFVFIGGAPAAQAGDLATVTGTVSEFRPGGASSTNLTVTQISTSNANVFRFTTGNDPPAATVIGGGGRVPPTSVIEDDAIGSVETSGVFDPATDGIDFYESLEAMRVTLGSAVVVGPTNDFGELWVLPDNGAGASLRTARGGIVIRPGDFNPERVQLDDAIADVPDANVGDLIPGPTTGVVNYDFGNFEVLVTSPVTAVAGGIAREVAAAAAPAELSVATFNVENLDPGDPPSKFAELANLIVNHLRSPDVIGLEEVQDNNGPTNDAVTDASVTLTMLAAAITAAGGPAYEFRAIDPVDDQDGGEPGGNIRVAFLFRTDRGVAFVDRPGGTPTSATGVVAGPTGVELTASPGRVDPANPAWASSRKPLAGEFLFRGEKYFVIVNHFNSKGGDQPLFGRFQPPALTSEAQRRRQAETLRGFIDRFLALDPNANVIALGDFNDFEFSAPLEILKGDTMNDLIETLPPNERYGYVFDGNSQALDHILVSDNVLATTPLVYDVVHVNAEFYEQASDHDPSVVRLRDQARLALTKTPSTDAVARGGVVSYFLRVTNNGPKPATDVVLADVLPPGLQLLGASASQGSCSAAATVTCALGTLASGASATVSIDVRATLEGELTNTAHVAALQDDPNPADNRASATTRVGPPLPPPPPPPPSCRITAAPKTLVAGRRAVLRVHLQALGPRRPLGGVAVSIRGAGVIRAVTTNANGRAQLMLRPKRTGVIRVKAKRSPSCSTAVTVRRAPRRSAAGGS